MTLLSLLACAGGTLELVEPDEPRPDSEDVAGPAGMQDWEVGRHLKRGRGCAIADLDADGDPDVVLANPGDETYVMLNESTPGRLRFEPGPILSESALVWSVAAADVDGDGDVDLFAAIGGLEGRQFDRLLRNELVETGALSFVDATDAAGIAGPWRTDPDVQIRTASLAGHWVDYDRDADLDLWVDSTHWPSFWRLPGAGDILGRNQLWRNDGDGSVSDVAVEAGLGHLASTRFSSWLDFDGDGDLDLYENGMQPSPSFLWRQEADHTFVDVSAEASLDGSDVTMPPETFVSATADFNNDGWDDLLLFVRGFPTDGPQLLGHTLLLNVRGRGFVDATGPTNLNDPFLAGFRDHESNGAMGATARDLNGDGIPDVFVGNGGPSAGYPNGLYLSTGLREVDLGPESGILEVPVYENRSDLIGFPAEPPVVGFSWPPYPYRSHAGCVADLDGDGPPELLVMNGGMIYIGGDAAREPNRLFRFHFDPEPGWVSVSLRGDGVHVPFTPVGARIAVTARRGEETWVVRDTLRTTEGFAAQHGLVRSLGVGDAEEVVSIEVTWPDGAVDVVEDVAVGERVHLHR